MYAEPIRLNRILPFLALAAFATGCGTTNQTKEPELPPFTAYRIYATNEASGDLSVIDSATNTLIANIPLGKRPRGIHASPDRKTIYVALSGSPFAGPGVDESTLPPPDRSADGMGIFDVATNKLLRVIDSGEDPEQFDLTKDGKFLYVSNEDSAKTSVVDLTTDKVLRSFPVGNEPEGVTLTPDGKFVYVTSEGHAAVFIIDTTTEKVVKQIKTAYRPRSVAFLPDGSKAYATCEEGNAVAIIDANKQELIRNLKLGDESIRPMGIVMSQDGSKAYVSTGRGQKIFVLDTATDKVLSSFDSGGQRPWGIALSPDGKMLYTANGPSNDVSVIDLATEQVVTKVKVSDRPWGIITLAPPAM